MKTRTVFTFIFFWGLATGCHAADNGKANFALPSVRLGDYSVKLDTSEPRQISAPDPSGLTTMRQQSVQAFLGFRLSRPLPDDFWNFAR